MSGMSILQTIAAYARERVEADRAKQSLDELKSLCGAASTKAEYRFESALRRDGISFICEVKKASPSKGIISPDFPYLSIAREYERAGADCVSCLTEPKWFLGSDEIFGEIRRKISIPMLRKDFTVDEYQIYQAKLMGADAVLLICSLLDTPTLADYIELCGRLGMSALVETHDEREISSAVEAGARIIGVNNRNLNDFTVDFSNAARLRETVPPGTLFISESGVRQPSDIALLRSIGVDGVLIGEALMRADDKKAMLDAMRAAQ